MMIISIKHDFNLSSYYNFHDEHSKNKNNII